MVKWLSKVEVIRFLFFTYSKGYVGLFHAGWSPCYVLCDLQDLQLYTPQSTVGFQVSEHNENDVASSNDLLLCKNMYQIL